jgi:hypothetical protein
VRKYVTRNADKMSGFKHSIKKQSKGGGGGKMISQLGINVYQFKTW